ncbi:MAG: glucosyltransferase domain-containing protein [Bacteroidales bacterium]|jgi:hypothetical protein|nr:glucosyltransferase domain-containing protein [Bacteroidales bacterium]
MNFIKHYTSQVLSLGIEKKELWRSVLFLSIVYAVAFIALFRADYTYLDDIERSVMSIGLRGDFSRHISQFLSYFIHATVDERLTDISPLSQIISCILLATAGFMVVKIMCGKPTLYLLLATLPIGLSPNFLGCMSFKFDAPYMALSVLASVFPFLFMHRNHWLFLGISVISLLIMLMTYQASSGIFIMIVLYFFFRTILSKSDSIKNAFRFIGISCASFIAALILFRLFFLQIIDSYASTNIELNFSIFTVFGSNWTMYWQLIRKDWNVLWQIIALVIVVIFYIKTIIHSKQNKIVAFFVTTLFLILLALSVFGVYPLLAEPSFVPRAMYGIGILLAILSVDICFSLKKIYSFPVVLLVWCFFVFSFAYGNCLADQKRYKEFRAQILMHDIAQIIPTTQIHKIIIHNGIGFSSVVQNVAHNNPIVKRLIKPSLSRNYLAYYHNFPQLEQNEKAVSNEKEIPVVLDSFYHTIQLNDEYIVITLK